MVRYQTFSSFDSKNSKLRGYLKWWSDKTKKEQRMITRSVKFFKENLIFAVFAFKGNEIIGAAGLIPCLNRHKKEMHHNSMLVVELASNFVEPDYRDNHIGTQLVLKRIDFCKKNDFFPVSVTGSAPIQAIFSHLAHPMKDFQEYKHIYREVRVCECEEPEDKKPCKICPLKDRAIWVFYDKPKIYIDL